MRQTAERFSSGYITMFYMKGKKLYRWISPYNHRWKGKIHVKSNMLLVRGFSPIFYDGTYLHRRNERVIKQGRRCGNTNRLMFPLTRIIPYPEQDPVKLHKTPIIP